MKRNIRRLAALLLALALSLSLAPAARGEEEEVTARLVCGSFASSADYSLQLEPGSTTAQGVRVELVLEPKNSETEALRVTWKSEDPEVADVSEQENGRVASIYGRAPGETTVTVEVAGLEPMEISVVVSGIKLLIPELSLLENETKKLQEDVDYQLFGSAATADSVTATIVNDKTNIFVLAQGKTVTVQGRQAGEATLVLGVPGRAYTAELPVKVTPNVAVIPWEEPVSVSEPLKFSELEELLRERCREETGAELVSVIGLTVPTEQGILHLGYKSPEDPGAGVGGSITYYVHTAARGPYIRDVTFVPNPSYTGEKAVIAFTGQATGADGLPRTFKGRVEAALEEAHTDVVLTTRAGEPLALPAESFARVCQEQTGSPLGYVAFTLPPAGEGALYRDYKGAGDYGSLVSAAEKYDRKGLAGVSFVPAPGFVGTVSVGYAGYSVSGSKYTGEMVVRVTQALDEFLTYNDNGSGYADFSRGDFDAFCENATGKGVGSVSFTPPPASQGTLYYNWNGSRGTAVTGGNSYSAAQLDRLTFVAADGFHGVVRIPFSGESRGGAAFSGTAEVHIQSSAARNGDVNYTCAPGQSVKLETADFSALCQSLTGQRLHYISFQSLPDYTQGSLYHGRTSSGGLGTRVTTVTKYFLSATPYIANLSFWAAENFRGPVEIPFTGCAVTGETFTGLLAISSGTGDGGGSSGAVRYTAAAGSGVPFSGGDFDAACRRATNAALSHLRFDLPSSYQGILYYGGAPAALEAGRTLYRSGEASVDKVSFVPAGGFSGVAIVTYTGWSIDGREFRGTVEIAVAPRAALGGLVRYETGGAPVRFSAYDLLAAAGGQPLSLRLTGLPPESQGKLYYQYAGPTRYSWPGDTSTEYSLYGDPSVSNLAFVPRAGFCGTVEIPYAAANRDGSGYTGTIQITVGEPAVSASFDDLAGYPAQLRAAADYLASLGVVNGTAPRTYEPDASIRRGDFCLMLARAFQFNVGGSAQGFADVPAGAYYAQAVNQLYALDIVKGVGGGKFQPSAPVSRQDAALMVQRALEKAGLGVPDGNAADLSAFGDRGQVADYALGAVSGLVRLGLLPVAGGKLAPGADLTRGDMALLLHRAMTR